LGVFNLLVWVRHSKIHCMKQFAIKSLSSLLFFGALSACTPDIERSLQKEWKALKAYDVLEDVSLLTGFRDAFPNNKEKMIRQDKNLCLHEDAHNRQLSANGLNDKIGYRYCTLTPAPAPVPSRWVGQ
jgi:hypothetical protein